MSLIVLDKKSLKFRRFSFFYFFKNLLAGAVAAGGVAGRREMVGSLCINAFCCFGQNVHPKNEKGGEKRRFDANFRR